MLYIQNSTIHQKHWIIIGLDELPVEKTQVQMSSESGSDETINVQMESDEPQEVVSECYLGFADVSHVQHAVGNRATLR